MKLFFLLFGFNKQFRVLTLVTEDNFVMKYRRQLYSVDFV